MYLDRVDYSLFHQSFSSVQSYYVIPMDVRILQINILNPFRMCINYVHCSECAFTEVITIVGIK